VCEKRNYSVLPYTSWILCLKWTSPFIWDYFRNNRPSTKYTNINYIIFPISERRYGTAPKSLLSLSEDLDQPLREVKQLIEIVGDRKLKDTFKQAILFEFWSPLRIEYPETAKHAVQLPLPLVSTHHCEAAFMKYTLTKTKQRSRLDPEADMQVK